MANELRAKLTLDTRSWKASLESARRDMATGLRPGPGSTSAAGTFSAQLKNLLLLTKASAGLRMEFDHLGGAQARLAKLAVPFLATANAGRGLRQMFQPGEARRQAQASAVEAAQALGAKWQELKPTIGITPNMAKVQTKAFAGALQQEMAVAAKWAAKPADLVAKTAALAAAQKSLTVARTPFTGDPAAGLGLVGKNLAPYVAAVKVAEKELAVASTTAAKTQAAFDRVGAARANLTQFVASIRGSIKTGAISATDAKKQLAPLIAGVKQAKENLAGEMKVGLFDRILGGAGQFLVNLGTIVKSVGGVFFTVFRAIGAVALTVARTIVAAIGSALSFIKDSALLVGKIVGGVAVAAGGALAAGLHAAFEHAKELVNSRALTGVPIKQMVTLGRGAEMTGVDQHNLNTEINRMQHNLSGVDEEAHKTQAALRALGLDLNALRQMTPQQQLLAIGTALRQLKDPADKAAAVINIFTVRGHEMIGFLNQAPEVLALAAQQVGALGTVLEKNAGKFAFIARSFDGLKTKALQFFSGVGSGLADQLAFLANGLNKLDFVNVGTRLGNALGAGLDFFIGLWNDQSTSLWDVIELGGQAAFDEVVAFGKKAWQDLKDPLKDTVWDALVVVKDALIYGFEAAAPTLGEILGKVIGVAIDLMPGVKAWREANYGAAIELREDAEKELKKQEGIAARGGPTKVLGIDLLAGARTGLDDAKKAEARARELSKGGNSAAFAKSVRAAIEEVVPKPDATQLTEHFTKLAADLPKIGAGVKAAVGDYFTGGKERPKTPAEQAADQQRLAAANARFDQASVAEPFADKAGPMTKRLQQAFQEVQAARAEALKATTTAATFGTTPGSEKFKYQFALDAAIGKAAVEKYLKEHPELNKKPDAGDQTVIPLEKVKPQHFRGGEHEVTNQFERVGLFASKATGAGLDHMRRIADNTARAAAYLEKMYGQTLNPGHHAGPSVWH